MRIVVVGAGVVGLLTALECVRAGALVDVVDQGDIPYAYAASFDSHRVVRALHRGDIPLTMAAARLSRDWLEIERLLGARFYYRSGVLTAMAPAQAETTLALLTEAGAGAAILSPGELTDRYPQVSHQAGTGAVFEPQAGTVNAGGALSAAARWLTGQPGVRMHPARRVVAVEESGAVVFDDGSALAADRIVVAAGPWSRSLLPGALAAQLTMKRQTMLSYAPPASAPSWAGSPAILGLCDGGDAWVMPPIAGAPARMSAASACRTVAEMTDRVTSPEWHAHLVGRFSRVLPGFDPAAVIGASEGYYLTDDSGRGPGPMLVDLHDGAVVFYAACGGMSFKFAPPVARALADRALGRAVRPTGMDVIDRPRQLTAVHPERRPR